MLPMTVLLLGGFCARAEAQRPAAPPAVPSAAGADKPAGDALAQEAEAKPKEPEDEKGKKKYEPLSGHFAAGFSFTQGNSDTRTFNAALALQYDPRNRNVIKADAFYILNSESGTSTYVAMNMKPSNPVPFAPFAAVPLTLEGFRTGSATPVARRTITAETDEFRPISVVTGDEADTIDYVTMASPAEYMYVDDVAYSDAAQPDTEITSGPARVTNRREASFDFVASVAAARFECDLDGDAGRCSSPTTVEALTEGPHVFTATAISNAYEDRDPSPARYTWRVDLTPPATTIDSGPPPDSRSRSATIAFSSPSTDTLSFGCSLDGATFTVCASPVTYTGLAEGSHSVRVRARDRAGNVDGTPATTSWRVDVTAPATAIDSGPPPLARSRTATVAFSSPSTDAVSFGCSLDGATFTTCTSPATFTGLSERSHSVRVRARDRAGNVDGTPAAISWTVDVTAPRTQIDTRPAPTTRSTEATLTFSSPDADVSRFSCSLDTGAFAACTSPKRYTGLAEGSHRVRVRAVDRAGNIDATPGSATWRVDRTAPGTLIEGAPPALSTDSAATFTFSSPAADATGFECALDAAPFAACTSPLQLADLADGAHRLQVRARDGAGNRDPSPGVHDWRVDRQPDTRIDQAPPAVTTDTAATLAFSSPDTDVARFECAFDGGAFAVCTSPHGLAGLALGAHTVLVRAVDASGSADPSPAAASWRVDAAVADRDADAVPDASDNCPEDANGDQADRDADRIGDACEVLPNGDVPPVAGVNSVVTAISGEVFVKLPGASLRAASPLQAGVAQSGIEKGFQPLKGIASVPVGSVLDTRKGRVAVSTAADFRKASDARHRAQTANFAAGIFRIKQARKHRRKAPRRPFTDLVLTSAAGAQAVCATKSRTSPIKGVVRRLSATTKGRFRAVGGASTTTVIKGATFITSDRCTGTLTEVGRGRAKVFDRRLGRTVTVKSGRAYLAKARLFAIKKGRRGQKPRTR